MGRHRSDKAGTEVRFLSAQFVLRCSSGLAIVSHKDEVVGSIPTSAILEIAIDSNLILKHVITNVYCLFHLRRTIMFVMTRIFSLIRHFFGQI